MIRSLSRKLLLVAPSTGSGGRGGSLGTACWMPADPDLDRGCCWALTVLSLYTRRPDSPVSPAEAKTYPELSPVGGGGGGSSSK